jgi:hypothetical protein
VVRDVKIIGLNLVYEACNIAFFNTSQLFLSMFIYSTKSIAFHTTIHHRAIIQIILVAEKYSFFIMYNKLNHQNTQKNHSKNVIIIILAIEKLLNCHTSKKYIASRAIAIAIHKSINVSIVSSHSPHHSIE